jgi:hypothetical protein
MWNGTKAALLAAIVIIGAGCSGGSGSDSKTAAEFPRLRPYSELMEASDVSTGGSALRADRTRYDFGRVRVLGGNVETVFQVPNDSPNPVSLVSVYTSCGCTTAVLEFEDGSQQGPFGMPGHKPPTRLKRSLRPGERVLIRVTFDPAAHGPEALGPVVRVITLHTQDGGELQLAIAAQVVRA